jgi:MurNAc alpha-1-phosphate uridylyltransferase
MTSMPASAMVFAAGLGTRMRPLTERTPKPLVRLAGRALIDHALDRLASAGVERAVVNVHHLADQIERHLASRTRPRIAISDERAALLDTGGGLLRARPLLGEGPILVHNCDTVWIEPRGIESAPNLARLANAFDPRRMDALLLLAPVAGSLGYDGDGDFTLGADGALARRAPGGRAPFVFAGASIAAPALLDAPPAGAFSLNVLWNRALAAGRLHGLVLQGTWMHVGTPEALAEAERRIARECASDT